MCSVGGYGLTVECGQHDDPAGADVTHHAVRKTLALLDIADLPLAPPARLFACMALAAVVDRHAEADRLARAWTSSDPLAAAALSAVRAVGSELHPPEAGYIIFPDVSALPAHEWFYLAQATRRPL